MPGVLKYIIDGDGYRTSVHVPRRVSEDLNSNYQKLQKRLDILKGISEGLNKVRQVKKTGRNLQTLKDSLK